MVETKGKESKALETFICRTGVKLDLRKPSSLALSDVVRQFSKSDPPPEVPTVWIENKSRDEPNPNDPNYKAAQMMWSAGAAERIFNVMIVTGVEIIDVPEGFPAHDSEDFGLRLQAMGLEPSTNPYKLRIDWIRFVAAKEGDDLAILNDKLLRYAGLSGEDVAEAMARFWGDEMESTDLASGSQEPNRDGDSSR